MATILLQAAGAFVGGLLGPVGSALGSAAGALAGYTLDRALIESTRRIEGPRLSGARAFTAEEGAPVPRVYGTARVGGTLIWATRFEESESISRQGGKGGAKVSEYSYYANVAFALCEGEIAGVRRIWADGREIDRTTIEIRVYRGTESQGPDPLIEARQGAGNAPAYRGLAYAVFERLPLGEYGNRIPQLQFEVLRPVGGLRHTIKGVALIPGATEYGLAPDLVTRQIREGETVAENRHVLHGATDFRASLDELQLLCPNLESISLVVTWFGDDLRAGQCRIRPAVTSATLTGYSQAWLVSGVERTGAMVVSTQGGGSAYGGTPTDRSVMDAIAEIRGRGIKVLLHPFIMMDVPAENALPNPYGGAAQPPYPWRGRITAYPAAGQPGAADKTASARSQIEAFLGDAAPGDFAVSGDTIDFSGAADDWGYRRFLLHFAHLAVAAGGVDAFLIGSELRGLTALRDNAGAFPFVEALCTLADEVHALLGSYPAITYGADWSEYFGHQPADGSGDVFFHLDPLWSRASITAVGIDNYMPLSDWRDADYGSGNPDGASGPYDADALAAAIYGGEGFAWYYPSIAARQARARTAISDGAYGKHWVFRYKDLRNWWWSLHHNRPGGVESLSPTAWVPQSKPIWFTELGCPAADKGPNQPNVFPDPKSAENASPYFSSEGRCDLAPKRFLEAHAAHWDPASPGFVAGNNPFSGVYPGYMVDPARVHVWAWDARPFPAFPLRRDLWSDGPNWHRGHWLNGRLEGLDLGGLINAILADHGLIAASVSHADGTIHGYVVDEPGSARSALEPLVDLFDLAVAEGHAGLVFRTAGAQAAAPIEVADMVSDGESTVAETVRSPDHELPAEAILAFRDPLAEFQTVSARTRRADANGKSQATVTIPGSIEKGQGAALASDWLCRQWSARETITFSAAHYRAGLEPGAVIRLPDDGRDFIVTEVEDGLTRRVTGRRMVRTAPSPWLADTNASPTVAATAALRVGHSKVVFLDLPASSSTMPPQDQFRVAIWRKDWKSHALLASPEETGFQLRTTIERQAGLGVLAEPLEAGVEGRVDRAAGLTVALSDAEAESVSRLQLLNGANAAAVRTANGMWEVLQFETAEEISAGVWRLSGLLRGQLGTGDAMAEGAEAGADLIMLNDAVLPAGLAANEIGLPLNWRVGPTGADIGSTLFSDHAEAGGLRARLPLSPAHVHAVRTVAGDIAFSWVRRGRLDADDWAPADIPLGEDHEEYRVEIAAVGGPVLRSAVTAVPSLLYEATDITSDFGGAPAALDVTVSQFSLAAGWGVPATRRINF